MSFRYPKGGFITAFYDPLKVPDAPTIGTATGGDAQASVTFTAPSNVGGSAITAYYAVSNPDRITATGASSPITVTGLTNNTAYTFQVWALNSYGPSAFSAASGSVTPAAIRGLFGGGFTDIRTNVIEYISIATLGNSSNFGQLTQRRQQLAACASSTRGIFGGGYNTSDASSNVIDYVTIATTGDATDFGDLTFGRYGLAGCNSSTRGLFGGGIVSTFSNIIDYITIASVGNATDFGDLSVTRTYLASCSSSTRGIFGGGTAVPGGTETVYNVIDYVTIASVGNATDFGDLTRTSRYLSSCSSATIGLFAGGQNVSNVSTNIIDYITIASTGNATDFGDLLSAIAFLSACSSSTRGVFAGGGGGNVIQYVTIASSGNALDFGDLSLGTDYLAACSNGNGGL